MLIRADARAIPLRDGVVQCAVTSPPYWGLRDYNTAEWVGGDATCDHAQQLESDRGSIANQRIDRTSRRGVCAKCGAYLVDRQVGLERVPDCLGWATGAPCGECYVCNMVQIFREVRRVLRDDGTLWLNLGDSYASTGGAHGGRDDNQAGVGGRRAHAAGAGDKNARKPPAGIKHKDLVGIPWRVALALQADGWYLRSDNIWAKPNPMPESVTDRTTKSHEYLFMLAKRERYYYDAEAIVEAASIETVAGRPEPTRGERYGAARGKGVNPDRDGGFETRGSGRNKRSVWSIAAKPYSGAHFATYPPDLIEPCILAGTSEGGQCASCGTPLVRVLADRGPDLAHQLASGSDANGEYRGMATKDYAAAGVQDASAVKASILAGMRKRETVGWQKMCRCATRDVVAQIVLDPFIGSGTTGAVCDRLGRRWVGLDLAYQHLSRKRTVQPGFRFTHEPLIEEGVNDGR